MNLVPSEYNPTVLPLHQQAQQNLADKWENYHSESLIFIFNTIKFADIKLFLLQISVFKPFPCGRTLKYSSIFHGTPNMHYCKECVCVNYKHIIILHTLLGFPYIYIRNIHYSHRNINQIIYILGMRNK